MSIVEDSKELLKQRIKDLVSKDVLESSLAALEFDLISRAFSSGEKSIIDEKEESWCLI